MLKSVTDKIRRKALDLGFDLCGVARCEALGESYRIFEQWLAEGCHGGLDYLCRNREKRFDPRLLMTGARSVVVCAVSYHRLPVDQGVATRIASYAHGPDYHQVLKKPLQTLLSYICEEIPGSSGRCFVDTAPLAEKSWARQAGLGWIGRHSLLIHPRLGSFVLLGEVVTTAELEPDEPFAKDGCGTCRVCVDACPVKAIRSDRTIDAGRCIARKTIEPGSVGRDDLHGWIFGCDHCQRVCPRNRIAPRRDHPWLRPVDPILTLSPKEWLELTPEEFNQWMGKTPLSRCGLERLQSRLRSENTAQNVVKEQ